MHDVMIIGGGPAGISAARWCDELGLDTLLLEQADEIGGQLHRIYNPIENYLGVNAASGDELLQQFRSELETADFDQWTGVVIKSLDLRAKRVALASGEELRSCFAFLNRNAALRDI